jgi:hypothetical protein
MDVQLCGCIKSLLKNVFSARFKILLQVFHCGVKAFCSGVIRTYVKSSEKNHEFVNFFSVILEHAEN